MREGERERARKGIKMRTNCIWLVVCLRVSCVFVSLSLSLSGFVCILLLPLDAMRFAQMCKNGPMIVIKSVNESIKCKTIIY